MQYVVQMEEVDISDGCEAVNVWDLNSSESLARARKLANPGCFGCRNDSVRDLERKVIMKDCFVLFRYYLEE